MGAGGIEGERSEARLGRTAPPPLLEMLGGIGQPSLRVPSVPGTHSHLSSEYLPGRNSWDRCTDGELWAQAHTASKRQRPDVNQVRLMPETSGPPHAHPAGHALAEPWCPASPSNPLGTSSSQRSPPGQVRSLQDQQIWGL